MTAGPTVDRVFRVLLVDDEALLCRAILRLMRGDRRFEFHAVTNSRQALEAFVEEGPFDLLLTDLRFPEADDGGEVLAGTLSRIEPKLKVVFMSGDIPESFAGRGLALDKPFDYVDLIRVLESALGLTR